MKYEKYLEEEAIYLHHALESADNVIKFCAYQQVKSLGNVVDSILESVPIDSLGIILQAATDKVLSKDEIRQLCYGIFLKEMGEMSEQLKMRATVVAQCLPSDD